MCGGGYIHTTQEPSEIRGAVSTEAGATDSLRPWGFFWEPKSRLLEEKQAVITAENLSIPFNSLINRINFTSSTFLISKLM